MNCTAPNCDRDTERGDLCRALYEQQRRARADGARVRFTPLRTSPGGAGERIQLRPSRELRAAIEQEAKREGQSVTQWVIGTLARALGVDRG